MNWHTVWAAGGQSDERIFSMEQEHTWEMYLEKRLIWSQGASLGQMFQILLKSVLLAAG